MLKSDITFHDMFCGAGGSTTGAKRAGAKARLALNHWGRAIETHNYNNPEADHDCADISQSDPRRYPSATILIASPECTNHTVAKGKKRQTAQYGLFEGVRQVDPAADRSRATMWDTVRFTEHHRYQMIIVENVVEARKWELFDAWLMAMHNMGYLHECVYLNSMFAHPTPQSRDRMYIVFWRKGNPAPNLDIRPTAFCEHCERNVSAVQTFKKPDFKWGRYGKNRQYLYHCPVCTHVVTPYYHAAANCIDWSLPIQRIGDRKKPLEQKTMDRIQFGMEKYRKPAIVPMAYTHSGAARSHAMEDAMPAQVGKNSFGVAIPQPFMLTMRGHKGVYGVSGMEDAVSTVVGSANQHFLIDPWILSYYTRENARTDIHDALPTQPGENRHALIMGYYGNTIYAEMQDAMPTQSQKAHLSLIEGTQQIDLNDVGFRMLKPHEIQRAMAFPDDYVILGNQEETIKQLGNAVTPPAMELLMTRALETFA
jgi:DNA (cytosine-5)-methyltransferase 1